MKLVIVESPTKSEAISRFLGSDYKVMASQGHVRDLSTRGIGGLGVIVEDNFRPDWTIPVPKRKLINELSAEVKKADSVILATDPDREGEAISYHLAELLGLPINSTPRVTFEEITKDVVLNSINSPRTIDMDLVHAQIVRRMEDRIVGFRVSSLLQRRVGIKSAGRVQSAALRMIVDRQNEIEEYEKRKKEYWTVEIEVLVDGKPRKATLLSVDGVPIAKKIDEFNKNATNIGNKEAADAILARIPAKLSVKKIDVTKGNKSYPPMPFTTSTMQQAAFNKYGFSNVRTQAVAQTLFEGKNSEHIGLITYMRTDSTRISPHFFYAHSVPYITERFGANYVGTLRKGEGAQDAHEAIRPTGTHRTPEVVAQYVSQDEAKIYRLIYCRAIASTMAPKISDSTKVILEGNGLEFLLSGTTTVFPGYTAIYGEFEEDDSSSLPEMHEGELLDVSSSKADQKFTKSNPPYNVASIVKAMEDKGIGRPSTYATTVETLVKRKYVTNNRGVLTPTEDGKACIDVLFEYFPRVIDLEYTAEMEAVLDKIAVGQLDFLQALTDFYTPFHKQWTEAKSAMTKRQPKKTGELCPICGKPLVERKSRSGVFFVGCSGYPECDYIRKEEKQTGEMCPECGAPLIEKANRKGEKFIGCSNFPNCHYTKNKDKKVYRKKETKPDEPPKPTDKPCPKCGIGHLVIRHHRDSLFFGCSRFPRCKFTEPIPEHKDE